MVKNVFFLNFSYLSICFTSGKLLKISKLNLHLYLKISDPEKKRLKLIEFQDKKLNFNNHYNMIIFKINILHKDAVICRCCLLAFIGKK